MFELLLPSSKIPNNVPLLILAPHHIFITHQSLQAHRASRMNPTRAYPNLGSEAIPIPISETRTGIYVRPC